MRLSGESNSAVNLVPLGMCTMRQCSLARGHKWCLRIQLLELANRKLIYIYIYMTVVYLVDMPAALPPSDRQFHRITPKCWALTTHLTGPGPKSLTGTRAKLLHYSNIEFSQ